MIGFLEFMFYMLVFVACIASISSFVLILGIARVMFRPAPAEKKHAPRLTTTPSRNAPGDPTIRPSGTGLLDLQEQMPYHLAVPKNTDVEG